MWGTNRSWYPFIFSIVLFQAEAAGPEYRLYGVVQRGVQRAIPAGAVRGLQTKCGAPLFSLSGDGKPSAGAPHSETQRHAHCHQGLFGRHEEALYPVLHPWVRGKIFSLYFYIDCSTAENTMFTVLPFIFIVMTLIIF